VNVLYVCADRGIPLDGVKGASIHVRQTVDGLLRRGHEVTVLAARPGGGWQLAAPVVVAETSPDGLRSAGTLASELDGLAHARDLVRAAVTNDLRPDLVYERYSLWSVTGAAIADALKVPLVLEVNAPLVDEQQRYRRLALGGVAAEIERFLMPRADAVLCVSSELAHRVRGLRGSSEGVLEFPNAVDTERFFPVPPRPSNGTGPIVVFVGTLKPWHGLPLLVRAFARMREQHPGARLRLIGEGPERKRLEALADDTGVSGSLEFLGAVEHERVPQQLQQADIAVAPYPPLENFYFSPLKVGEYLAAGLPVVASRCGDLTDLLQDGETALLVPPGDVPALAGALSQLATDESLRRSLGQAGRRLALERMSLDSAMVRLSGLLTKLVADASPRKQMKETS